MLSTVEISTGYASGSFASAPLLSSTVAMFLKIRVSVLIRSSTKMVVIKRQKDLGDYDGQRLLFHQETGYCARAQGKLFLG